MFRAFLILTLSLAAAVSPAGAQTLPDVELLPETKLGRILMPNGVPVDWSLGQRAQGRTKSDRLDDLIVLAPGNSVGYCSVLGCIPTGSPQAAGDGRWRHMISSLLISSETRLLDPDNPAGSGAEAQQNTLGIETVVNSGAVRRWSANTSYRRGENIKISFADGLGDRTYRVEESGTSGTTAPTDTSGQIFADGTVKLRWINYGATTAQTSIYNAVVFAKGGGPGWAAAHNVDLESGYSSPLAVNHEFDFTNNSGMDCERESTCTVILITPKGATTSTNAIAIGTKNQPRYRTVDGRKVDGTPALRDGLSVSAALDQWPVRRAAIAVAANHALRGVDVGTNMGVDAITLGEAAFRNSAKAIYGFWNKGTQSGAGFRDDTMSPVAFLANGSNQVAAFRTTGNSLRGVDVAGTNSEAGVRAASKTPSGVLIEGSNSTAAVNVRSSTPVGVKLDEGTFSSYQIEGNGFSVDATGGVSGEAVSSLAFFKFLKAATVESLTADFPCNRERKGEVRRVDGVSNPNAFRGRPVGGGKASSLVYCDGAVWHISG
ncbi:hypothetical protein [Jiella marina]|uniref:hypothetical protein n=1 Tax=Jiella sp. LLJ827 TaxID=2917712 RepID=UPI0021016E2C|nr:hypothetical protein [Jiella sp. LLJ827]MCQ0986455.1 hypothetical protein [Jiella sp. LLJ827]